MAKRTNWLLINLIISILAFALFCIPNIKGSENIAMVSMFEPDEGITVPVIQNMISPKGNWKLWVYNFVAYRYYFYGFPHFAPSALTLLLLKGIGLDQNMPLVMLSLRQVISVLPMLLAILLLIYMQDGFKTYRSVLLHLLLLSIPAAVSNGFWWHPDGLVMFLSVLVIFFLWHDERRFGKNFFFAAVFCGVLVALKVVGLYFFLAVGLVIIWGLVERKVSCQRILLSALFFILIMLAALYISNPFLLLSKESTITYINLIQRQSAELRAGYGIEYEKGLRGAWQTVHTYYGEAIFLLLALGTTLWGIQKKPTRFLHALTLAWFLPLTISLLFFSHFKYQYWLPVAIPLFSNLILLLPASGKEWPQKRLYQVLRLLLLAVLALQMGLFVNQSAQLLIERTQRADDHPAVAFYDQSMQVLAPISPDPVYAYYDYRLYLPEKDDWVKETSFDLLDYAFIKQRHYDILMLSQQRIWDYLNPSAVGVDPQQFALSQVFYQDADHGSVKGYHLLLRDETALLYIRTDFYLRYFDQNTCP